MLPINNARTSRMLQSRSVRAALLISTALGLAAGGQAHAQTANVVTDQDISYDAASVAGTPRAVHLESTGGTVTADIGAVTATATAGQQGDIVYMSTLTDKAIVASIDSITATGAGDVFGYRARTAAGNITIDIGTMDLAGASTVGLIAESTDGDIVLSGESVHTRGAGIDPAYGYTGDGLVAISTNGTAQVTLGSGQSDALYGSVAVAVAGGDASVTSGYAKTTGNQGYAVGAHSTGANATVDSGTVETTADASTAVQALADAGTATVTSGTVAASGANGRGIYARGAEGVAITAGDTNTGHVAIEGNSTFGDVAIVTTGDTVSRGSTAIYTNAHNVRIETAEGSNTQSQATGSAYRNAFTAYAADSATILNGGTARNASDGAAIFVQAGGDIDITSATAIATGENSVGIAALSSGGDIAIVSGSASTVGHGAIQATADNGTISITSGSASAEGLYGGAIDAFADGDIEITSGTATSLANAINAVSLSGNVTVTTTGDTVSTGSNAMNIDAELLATITTGEGTTTSGIDGIEVEGRGGVVLTNGGAVIASDGIGIDVETENGAAVRNNGSVTAAGVDAIGIAISGTGPLSLISNSVTVTGAGADPGADGSGFRAPQGGIAVVSETGGAITIESSTVDVEGDYRYGIYARSDGAIDINSAMLNYDAFESAGIMVVGGAGDVTIASETLTANGNSGAGIIARATTGNIAITAGTTRTLGLEYQGNYTAEGVYGETGGTVSIVSEDALAAGYAASAVGAIGASGVSIVSGKATTLDPSAVAMYGISNNGSVAIESGIVTAAGAGITTQAAGDITITSDTVTAGSGQAIYAGAGGNVTISTTGETRSDTSGAIAANGSNVSIVTGADSVTSAAGNAISATAANNATVDNQGTATSTGDYAAIFANAQNGVATITSANTVNTATGGAPSVAMGISGQGLVGVDIQAGTVDAGGAAIRAFSQDGYARITSTGDLTSRNFNTISISAGSFSVDTAEETTITSNGGTAAIAGAARNGDGTVHNRGTIRAMGNAETGIGITVAGDIVIESNAIYVEGLAAPSGQFSSGAISAVGTGGGDVTVSNQVGEVHGAGRHGIFASAVGEGDVTITSGTLSSDAEGFATLRATSVDGDIVIDSGTLTGSGNGSIGIFASSATGDISVTTGELAQTSTDSFGYYTAEGVLAETNGSVSIVSGTASADGWAASALVGLGGAGVTITSDSAAIGGNDGVAIYGGSANGDVTIASGSVVTGGEGNAGINAISDSGAVTITSDTIVNEGGGSNGVYGRSLTETVIVSGSVDSSNFALAGRSDGTVSIETTGTTTSRNAYAIGGIGANVVVETRSGSVTTAATDGMRIQASAVGGVLNEGAVRAGGAGVRFLTTAGFEASASAVIENEGSITSTGDAAIVSDVRTDLVNSGVLAGVDLAVVLSAFDDTVELRTGSSVNGVIDAGDGNDVAILNGSLLAADAGQTLAQMRGVETLDVAAGYWTAGTGVSEFGLVSIRQGATLQLDDVGGESPVEADAFVTNGTLALNYTGTDIGSLDGVLVSGSGGVALVGTGTLQIADGSDLSYTGGTTVSNGRLILTGTLAGDVTTNGPGILQLGDGGTSGALLGDLVNDGTFVYDRSDDYTLAGDFSGTGGLIKLGSGILTFDGDYGFEGTTEIRGGSVRFTGALDPETEINLEQGTLDLSGVSGGTQTISQLSGGAGGTVNLGGNQLVVNQTGNTEFAGSISGSGGLNKTGTGTLNITGTSSFTGNTNVAGGTLKVNGALPNSTVVVTPGGTVGGNGTVGGLNASGGTVAPGNSIGRLLVNGNVSFNAASTYDVEVNALGQSDRIDATGTATLGGGRVNVLPEPGRYRGLTSYTILTAQGGVTGTFGTVTSAYAFLTPTLAYSANAVTLSLTRNDVAFASMGTTVNQRTVGAAVQALGGGNLVFEEALLLSDTGAAPAFGSLSGELHASLATGLIENAQVLRRTVLDRSVAEGEGLYGWANVLGSWGHSPASVRNQRLETRQSGLLGGIGASGGGLDASIGIGATSQDFRADGYAEATSLSVTASIGYALDGFRAVVGGTHSWHDANTDRTAMLGALTTQLTDSYDGETTQLFGEIGFDFDLGGAAFGPFGGLAHVRSHLDSFDEGTAALALRSAGDTRRVTYSTLGVRLESGAFGGGDGLVVVPVGSAAWRHAWGDLGDPVNVAFAAGGGRFGVLGPVIEDDAADVRLGLELRKAGFRLNAGYAGTLSSGWNNHSAEVAVSVRF